MTNETGRSHNFYSLLPHPPLRLILTFNAHVCDRSVSPIICRWARENSHGAMLSPPRPHQRQEPMARAATTSDSFNAVAEPRRREILNYLALQERAVGEIVVGLKMEQPSVSKHLRVLRKVGLVRARRNGRHMFYRTNAEAIQPLYEWAKTFAAQWQHQ
jgi:DNA-binding transcriptional ArsR family regulator